MVCISLFINLKTNVVVLAEPGTPLTKIDS